VPAAGTAKTSTGTTGIRPAATGRTTAGIPRADRGSGGTTERLRTGTESIHQAGHTSARIHKGKSGLPARVKLIAALSILGLGGIISLLYWNLKTQVDPIQIQAELQARIDALTELGENDFYKKDAMMEDILANEQYRKHAPAPYKEVYKAHATVHKQADELRTADREVNPFLQNIDTLLTQGKLKEKKAVVALRDESSSKAFRFAATHYKPRLDAVVKQLNEIIASLGNDSPLNQLYEKKIEWNKLRAKHAFAEALKSINDFGARWKEALPPELVDMLNEERDNTRRQASAYADKLGKDALLTAGTDAAAAPKILKDARPELEGFPEAIEKLDQAVQAIEKKASAK
jgi:hypothetical protein